jgi:hypothetical protein
MTATYVATASRPSGVDAPSLEGDHRDVVSLIAKIFVYLRGSA